GHSLNPPRFLSTPPSTPTIYTLSLHDALPIFSGLPVYLVLAKCDLLARADETPEAWLRDIEERKTDVSRRFRNFLIAEETAKPADRKSTRLNSSHQIISYAVFCLKKKNSTSNH